MTIADRQKEVEGILLTQLSLEESNTVQTMVTPAIWLELSIFCHLSAVF